MRGTLARDQATSAFDATRRGRCPKITPRQARIRLSVMTWRRIRRRLAPRAARTAISRVRLVALASKSVCGVGARQPAAPHPGAPQQIESETDIPHHVVTHARHGHRPAPVAVRVLLLQARRDGRHLNLCLFEQGPALQSTHPRDSCWLTGNPWVSRVIVSAGNQRSVSPGK